MARTKFFGDGHRWSGFAPEQLGRVAPAYAGRGRVRTPDEQAAPKGRNAPAAADRDGQSIAARRAARLAEEQNGTELKADPGGADPDRVPAGRSTDTRRDV